MQMKIIIAIETNLIAFFSWNLICSGFELNGSDIYVMYSLFADMPMHCCKFAVISEIR